jgi:Metal-independent alpha-mannosidase (GH125)
VEQGSVSRPRYKYGVLGLKQGHFRALCEHCLSVNKRFNVTMLSLILYGLLSPVMARDCPNYVNYAGARHEPFSPGVYKYPYQRPTEDCRTYKVGEVEDIIEKRMSAAIADKDLHRLFENTWPNTLDTTVKWTGFAKDDESEEVRAPATCASKISLTDPAARLYHHWGHQCHVDA